MSKLRRIYSYHVRSGDLPEITEKINSKRDMGLFTARVIDIRWPFWGIDDRCIITVEMDGCNQNDLSWKEYIIKEF
jgi:hypothetical protein